SPLRRRIACPITMKERQRLAVKSFPEVEGPNSLRYGALPDVPGCTQRAELCEKLSSASGDCKADSSRMQSQWFITPPLNVPTGDEMTDASFDSAAELWARLCFPWAWLVPSRLSQPINPGWSFGNVIVNERNSSAP